MRQLFLIIAGLVVAGLLANTQATLAETPVVEWTRQLGTSSWDHGRSVSVDGSGNAYVTGETQGGLDGNTNAGHADMFLTKISAIPEPTTIILLLCGLASLALLRRRR